MRNLTLITIGLLAISTLCYSGLHYFASSKQEYRSIYTSMATEWNASTNIAERQSIEKDIETLKQDNIQLFTSGDTN